MLVVIWGLHAWLAEDDPADTAKELACEPESAEQASPRGLPARLDGYARRPGASPPSEARQAPSFQQGYAPQAGGTPPGVVSRFSGDGTDSPAYQGYRFRPSTREAKREPSGPPPAYSGQQFGYSRELTETTLSKR